MQKFEDEKGKEGETMPRKWLSGICVVAVTVVVWWYPFLGISVGTRLKMGLGRENEKSVDDRDNYVLTEGIA